MAYFIKYEGDGVVTVTAGASLPDFCDVRPSRENPDKVESERVPGWGSLTFSKTKWTEFMTMVEKDRHAAIKLSYPDWSCPDYETWVSLRQLVP